MQKFTFHSLKQYLLKHELIILILCFLLLLRIPNLFEPYWYGDEAIYLTIGTAMRYGLRLYAQIIDHKTPLIYYFAMVPNQFWFRMVLIGWMLITTLLFHQLTKQLRFRLRSQYLATILFVIFTTLPWLEGNIPNGELFVMGFVLMGATIFAKTKFFQLFLDEKIVHIKSVITLKQVRYIFVAGIFFSLAILTKVPALFDVAPFFSIGFFTLTDHFSLKRSRKVLFSILSLWELMVMAIVTPIIVSVIYFALRNSLSSYIDFGLLYNFRYAGSWSIHLPYNLEILLSMKAKLLIVTIVFVLLAALSRKVSAKTQFIISWCVLSLFGALLSSRPYPHYLLQIVPAFSLLIGLFLDRIRYKMEYALMVLPMIFLIGAIVGINFGFYSTSKYYLTFYKYLTKQITKEQYYQSFDSLMKDNYEAAAVLKSSPKPRIFIWGTNPTLYALSEKIPTGRFTVAFHIRDFPGAFEETYHDLTAYEPDYVVVMKSESIVFPEFFTYLNMNYYPFKELEHMTIYKKTSALTSDLE